MKKKTLIPLLSAVLFAFETPYAAPSSGGLAFNGSVYTDLGIFHDYKEDKKDEFQFRGITSLGLNFQNLNRRFGKVQGDIDFYLPHGVYLKNAAGIHSELDTLLFIKKSAPLLANVRKLYFSVYLPFADITLGRQIINFGKGYLFSPLDAFSDVELTDINLRRTGSDIGMACIPIGNMSGIDLVVQIPFMDQSHSSALKLYTTLGGWDLSLVGIYRHVKANADSHDEMVAGIAFKGDLEAGIYGEVVTTARKESGDISIDAMAGIDYSIGNRILFSAEYLFMQSENSFSPWGEHNAFGSVRYVINDIMNVSGSVIQNFGRKLTIGTIQYYCNVLQNVNTVVYISGYRGMPRMDADYGIRVEVKF